jgi:hypothetical protein
VLVKIVRSPLATLVLVVAPVVAAPVAAVAPINVRPAQRSAPVTCTAPVFATPAAAADAFADVPGISGGAERWLNGDGGWTVVHPLTCNRLHIFGDSAVLNAAGEHVMPSGNAVLQDWTGLRLITRAQPMIPDSPDGSRDWPGPVLWENGRLYSFTSHIKSLPGGGWEDLGKDLAEFTWDGITALAFKGKWVMPSSGRPGKETLPDGTVRYNIAWGAAAVSGSAHHYVYGTYKEDGWFGNRVFVARVPKGLLTNLGAWRFWDGGTWVAGEENATEIISEYGGPESAFSVYLVHPTVRIVSKEDGTYGSMVTKWTSPGPVSGPFTTSELFLAPWVRDVDETYLAIAHGDMRYADGKLPITISHGRGASGSLGDMWEQPARYRNTWHAVTP